MYVCSKYGKLNKVHNLGVVVFLLLLTNITITSTNTIKLYEI